MPIAREINIISLAFTEGTDAEGVPSGKLDQVAVAYQRTTALTEASDSEQIVESKTLHRKVPAGKQAMVDNLVAALKTVLGKG